MCDLATASYVATALGTAASYEGGQQSKSAMSKAQAAEAQRQSKFRTEASALFDQSLGAEGVDAKTAADAAAIKDREATATAAQSGGVSTPVASSYGNKSKVVSDESNVRSAAGSTAAGMESRAKAKLAGFADANQLNAIKNARMRLNQGNIAGNMAGSAAALGTEMDYASHAGDNWKNIGAGLSTAGTLTGLAAAAGVGATTAEELAKASIEKTGTAVGSSGEVIMSNGTGGYNAFNPKTGENLMGLSADKVNWGSFTKPAHLSYAKRPALFNMFTKAPQGYVAPSSGWFGGK